MENKLEKKGFVKITTDEADRRKQRVELTEYCLEFCKRNNEVSAYIMGSMFQGVSEEQRRTTIRTIVQIEENLKEM